MLLLLSRSVKLMTEGSPEQVFWSIPQPSQAFVNSVSTCAEHLD